MQTKILKHKSLQSGIIFIAAMLLVIISTSDAYAAFDSGSTCADTGNPDCLGAFSPTVNTVIDLPPDGILDYTTFTVPAGVTITFTKNAANTPVIIRTTGNVTIDGVIDIRGTAAKPSGTAGGGNLGDDGQPGLGGPGGYDGGFGGYSPLFGGSTGMRGGGGQGPGGGQPGQTSYWGASVGGGGGGFGTGGAGGYYGGAGGGTYGQTTLLPLVGGSGGGGGGSGSNYNGGGGGGGGGAIMIASSETIMVKGNGYIIADGMAGGESQGDGCGGGGGGGSGGAIRLVGETVSRANSGALYARGSGGGGSCSSGGGGSGAGRIRIEANTTGWTGWTDPAYTFGTPPGKVFVPNNPTLSMTHVAGNPVPANPTGSADITLPQGTAMPVTVNIAATNIPRGTTVTVYVVPSAGNDRTSLLSTALDGASDAATTATAEVTLKDGNNTLLATATYTVTELASLYLPTFEGERVAKIRVESTLQGGSRVMYITAAGKEYPAD